MILGEHYEVQPSCKVVLPCSRSGFSPRPMQKH